MEQDVTAYARKYRPTSLEEYIGNEEMVSSIRDILNRANQGLIKRPQSFLLSGHTGCGKTTMARLLAKEYMCENPGENGSCGECDNCRMVYEYITTGDTSQLYDIQEIDVTDKGGKNDVSEFVEQMGYPSQLGGWKVFILDESHLLTEAGASLLLKVVEEPPEDTLVIFCTTDPEKMLDTLKNRCQVKKYVKKPSLNDLSKLLGKVCETEGVTWDREGLRIISLTANFVIRNALNLLEQVVTAKGNARGESVGREFGTVTDETIIQFLKGYSDNNVGEMVRVIFQIKTTVGLGAFLDSIESFVVRGIYLINDVQVEGLSNSEVPVYLKLFKEFTEEELTKLISSISSLRKSRNLEIELLEVCFRGKEVDNEVMVCSHKGLEGSLTKEESLKAEQKLHYKSIREEEKKRLKSGLNEMVEGNEKVTLADMLSTFPIHEAVE